MLVVMSHSASGARILLSLLVLATLGCSQSTTLAGDSGAAADAPAADAPAADAPAADAPTADAPAADASATDAGTCDTCLADPLAWGTDGGLACTRDSSALAPCRDYTHRRLAEACDPIDLTCTNALSACPPATDVLVEDLAAALADPDVTAALAAAPVLYGSDPRPADGSVDWFTVGSHGRVEVGTGTVPAGVAAFVALLHQIDSQQLARPGCVEVFSTP